jgi:heme exporter protein D|tara:strand:+ start:6257 stop:6469 length:213 start_codon:yes stop_codon:yes gene_type:complete
MATLANFLDMGGYGAFVWSSYLACVALLAWLYFSARHSRRKLARDLEAMKAAHPGRDRRARGASTLSATR